MFSDVGGNAGVRTYCGCQYKGRYREGTDGQEGSPDITLTA